MEPSNSSDTQKKRKFLSHHEISKKKLFFNASDDHLPFRLRNCTILNTIKSFEEAGSQFRAIFHCRDMKGSITVCYSVNRANHTRGSCTENLLNAVFIECSNKLSHSNWAFRHLFEFLKLRFYVAERS